jgi:hypothetical protein
LAFLRSLWNKAKSTLSRSAIDVALGAISKTQLDEIEDVPSPLRTACVGRDNHAVLHVEVIPDVLHRRGLGVKLDALRVSDEHYSRLYEYTLTLSTGTSKKPWI